MFSIPSSNNMKTLSPRGRGKKKTTIAANVPAAVPGVAAAAEPSSQNRRKNQSQMIRKPSPAAKRNNGKCRRHTKKLRHEIATWWMSSPADNRGEAKPAAANGENNDSPSRQSLSEGENWVVCSFVDECKPTTTAHASKPLHLSIIKSHRNLYLDRGHIKGGGAIVLGSKDVSLTEDGHEGKPKLGNVAVLCIDVDNEGHCVAVKDIRLSPAVNNHLDAESKKADGLEFFLVRRRPREQHDQRTGKDQLKLSNNKAKSEDALNGEKKEDTLSIGSGSDNDGTSGYGTDDEKDANDEIEEMNERNEVRFCDDLVDAKGHSSHPNPPRETDVDKEGNMLYHHPEPLPRRQLRVLQDGDRILMRYWSSPSHQQQSSEWEDVPCVKLEYLHGQHHQQCHARKPKAISAQLADADKDPGETLGKPRLLSVKSTDGKSYAKKLFTLNSTSAAEAPTDDAAVENAKKAAADANNADGGRRKTGEDWSDVERPKKGQEAMLSGKQEKGGRGKNAEEDDERMEEYSYLTGEVMVRDQDYISSFTGDDATMPPAMALDKVDDAECNQENDGGDAATANAVVLGATASPSKTAGRMPRGLQGDGERDGDADEEERAPPETRRNDEKEGEDRKSSSEKNAELIEEAGAKASDDQDVFLTALEQETDDDKEEENNSEEELLSQPDSQPDNGDSPVKFEFAVAEQAEEEDESDDSETDISKTQPFPIPKHVMNNTSLQSLSTAEEERDDDSTECPEEIDDQKIAADDTGVEKAFPSPPAKLDAVPETAEKEGADKHDSDDLSDDQPTQPWAHGIANTNNPETAEKEEADEYDSDELSDEEPTQKFPSMKPLGDVTVNNLHSEDDEAYQAETQSEDDIFQEETQTLLPFNLAATLSHPEPGACSTNIEDKLPAKPEMPNNHTNEENNSTAANETSLPQNDSLKEAEENIDTAKTPNDVEEGQGKLPAESERQKNDIKEGRDLTILASNPTAAKGVDLPLAPGKSSVVLENGGSKKGENHEPESTTPPPAKEPPEQVPECRAAAKDIDLPLPPEKSSGVLENEGPEKGEQHEPESTKLPPAKEPPLQVSERRAAGKDLELPLPPEKTSGVLENGIPEKGEEDERESTKLPPAKKTPLRVSQRRSARRATYDDSAIQKQLLENSAVTRVHSGAIMTGPVEGAIALPSQRYSHPRSKKVPPKQEPNLLTSIAARQSNVLNLNPLPNAAASSEETTVCHIMDNTELKKDQGSTTVDDLVEGARNEEAAHSALQKEECRDERNGYAESRDRDPNIPSSISCINTRGGHARQSNIGPTTPHYRPKRNCGISSSGRRRESNEAVRIMFTGINPTRRHKQMINDIGAQLVDSIEDALTATHVIASDGKTKVRRTPKLMICVCKTSQILSIEWLEQSAKEQRVLDTNDFLLVGDEEAEKTYNFSMKETLENGRKARLDRDGVLGGWYVYICSGVAGNNAPSSKDLTLITQATGATLLGSLKTIVDPLKTIVITSEPSTQSQLKERGVARVEGLGAKILSTSWLFHTIITQNFSTTVGEGPTPHSGKQKSKRKASKSPPSHGNRRKSSRKR